MLEGIKQWSFVLFRIHVFFFLIPHFPNKGSIEIFF